MPRYTQVGYGTGYANKLLRSGASLIPQRLRKGGSGPRVDKDYEYLGKTSKADRDLAKAQRERVPAPYDGYVGP